MTRNSFTDTRRRLTAGAALALCLVSVAAAAGADPGYVDPFGDNGSAMDLGEVFVELGSDGYIHINPTILNFRGLHTEGFVLVGVDTDRNRETGAANGADYLIMISLLESTVGIVRWYGSRYSASPAATGDVRAVVRSGGVEFQVKPAALGGATSFDFFISAGTGSGDGTQLDAAPDSGSWPFDARTPAPAPAPTPVLAVATAATATYAPAVPRAGRAFRVTGAGVRLDNGSSVAAETFRCRARLAGKALRGTGTGGCTFAIPKTAKGKRLVITVSATYAGRTLSTAPRAFVIR